MSKSFIRIWFILLITVAAYIRIHGVGEYHYNQDELLHLDISKGKTLQEVIQFSLYEAHPPLLYIFLHYWLMISDAPAFVRGLPFLFSLAIIPLYYAIGKKLNTELTGLVAAMLVAFSFGLISQSCLVRQYNLLVFFISASFYCYLYWHENRSKTSLGGYFAFGILACLTHFSAIFFLFPIAATETVYMAICKMPWRAQLKWAAVNLVFAAIFFGLLWARQSNLEETSLHGSMDISQLRLLLACAIISLLFPAYILPSADAASFWIFLLPAILYYSARKRYFFLIIPVVALGLEMFLKASAIYPYGKRHDLWLTPFVILPMASMLADFSIQLYENYSKKISWDYCVAGVLFIAGILSYNPQSRFSDSFEYLMKQNDWQSLNNYIATLDASHLIVTERDDAFLLKDPDINYYNYISPSNLDTVVLSLKQTRLMSHEFYHKMFYEPATFIHTMEETQRNGLLDGVDTLVFARSSWYKPIFRDLFLCSALDKKIIFFPPLNKNTPPTTDDIITHSFVVIEISKKKFFSDFVSEDGRAHSCLSQ